MSDQGPTTTLEITPATLPFLAGYLAGRMDWAVGTGTQWTMMVYEDMRAGKLDVAYLTRLEHSIARRWPLRSEPAPAVRDVTGTDPCQW
jgi:hypothetical protein